MCAPTGPIQLRAGAPPGEGAETLNDASCGEYESMLSARRLARLRPTKPTISLSLLLSEGVRIRTTISPFYPGAGAQNFAGSLRSSAGVPQGGTLARDSTGYPGLRCVASRG